LVKYSVPANWVGRRFVWSELANVLQHCDIDCEEERAVAAIQLLPPGGYRTIEGQQTLDPTLSLRNRLRQGFFGGGESSTLDEDVVTAIDQFPESVCVAQ